MKLLGLLCGLGLLLAGCAPTSPPSGEYWPTRDWRTSTPEAQGMDSEKLAQLLYVIRQEAPLHLHSLLVIRHGYLVTEVYFTPNYGPDTKQALYSVTKSVVSTLVGIAFDKHLLTDLHQPVLSFFPRRTIDNPSADKSALTVDDLLTMRCGFSWQETTAWPELVQSLDAVTYVLNKPMTSPPGTQFLYDSGCSHVLSGILQQLPGVQTLEYAKTNLFGPLGISDFTWDSDKQGVALGGAGLYLRPRDMAKLGYLYLHQGIWDGRQIVSAAWVKAATETHADPHHKLGFGYSYQWWTFPRLNAYMALGAGGQIIFVAPASDLVVVVTADQADQANEAVFKLIEAYILTAVKSASPLPQNPAGQADLAAETKTSQQTHVPTPLAASAVHATAEQWSILLLGWLGLWALTSKSVYLGNGEVTGWAARGLGLAALTIVVLQLTHHSTCDLLFSGNYAPDIDAQMLALVVILGGWQAGRAGTASPPPSRPLTAAGVCLTIGMAGGALLGIALQNPTLFTLPTLAGWTQALLTGLGISAIGLALLYVSDTTLPILPWPTALASGPLIGWLLGYLGQGVVGFLASGGAVLAVLPHANWPLLLTNVASVWFKVANLAQAVNQGVALLLIVFGIGVIASRRLYIGAGRQITGWAAVGLGLMVIVVALVRGSLQPFNDLALYLISRCLGPDLVAHLLALGLIFGGLVARRLPTVPARPGLHWLPPDGLPHSLGLAVGCLLGVGMKDPVLLNGDTLWLATRLALTTVGLTAIALVTLAQSPAVERKIPWSRVLAGGLFLGWTVGFLAEGMVSTLWPI